MTYLHTTAVFQIIIVIMGCFTIIHMQWLWLWHRCIAMMFPSVLHYQGWLMISQDIPSPIISVSLIWFQRFDLVSGTYSHLFWHIPRYFPTINPSRSCHRFPSRIKSQDISSNKILPAPCPAQEIRGPQPGPGLYPVTAGRAEHSSHLCLERPGGHGISTHNHHRMVLYVGPVFDHQNSVFCFYRGDRCFNMVFTMVLTMVTV